MSTDFELCSYSDAFGLGTLNSNALKCDNYGAFFCKICGRYWCNDHRCLHLLAYSSEDSLGCVQEPRDFQRDEDENNTDINISMGLCYLATHLLRERRDKLFLELKAIQREIDLRGESAAAIARDLSTTNLDNWLSEKGYNGQISRRSRSRNSSSPSKRIQRTTKGNREAIQAIQTLFQNFTEKQIQAFIEKAIKKE